MAIGLNRALKRSRRLILLAVAIGSDVKGNISLLIYVIAIGVAFFEPLISCGLYCLVAAIWLVPDRRIEKTMEKHETDR